ncbi:hypothetical protein [Bradyrhizobium sp. SYSU BS000235]|uniref:hypothetical protein n=1 Tax=Bradyrhizobium sp. SYSU BS000235 TaxID=3411332 RepID=UPI003C74597B
MRFWYIPFAILIHCLASLVIAPSIVFLVSDTLVGQWTTNLAMLRRGLLDDALRPYMLSACFAFALAPGLVGVWSGRELILGRALGAKSAAILAAISGALSVLLYLVLLHVLRASGHRVWPSWPRSGFGTRSPWSSRSGRCSSRIVRAMGRRDALR